MKKRSLLFIILTSTAVLISTTGICMENKSTIGTIGTIDTLMLARSVFQQGYTNIEDTINKHQFIATRQINNRNIRATNPYYIKYYCSRNENSALADQVFDRIDKINTQQMTLTINNKFNQRPNALDECTRWRKTKNSDEVKVTAAFYDKKYLLATLNKLPKDEIK